MIAGEQFHFAGRGSRRYADTIAIRIGRDHEIGISSFREINSELQGLRVFGVRRFDRWKSSVKNVLLGHNFKIETKPLEQRFENDSAGSMQGGEDDEQRFRRRDNIGVDN